ncbi:aryl-sulfate sulfotransferase [Engelhardtia mirabilis]|uniref:Arylsulfotransferase (ASST) n=1 Tax=Engelhardtia mirabilis TaxID=2528011 RepID=A0A518BM17_9BACT|nr:Arylsulfotransferase (ASST) [Planctomycetes bacterium Pla133]QDV02347.1 Arylsulfotransferase (ASST) [Planctomycetes bacterium Pla86]
MIQKTPALALTPLALGLLIAVAPAQTPQRGLTLFNPNADTNTYLIDNSGQVVHSWAFGQMPGNTVYLEPDGTLLRCKQVAGGLTLGGFGGGIQRAAFDGTLTWDLNLANAQIHQHHDAISLPNGNVLTIVWERLSAADAIAAGRNPSTLAGPNWIPDAIVEYRQTGPSTGVEVWRWRAMDHLIQDFDPTKANFGVVADHPERLDINFPPTGPPTGEWLHVNSVSYDPVFDQVLINSPFRGEFWIVDHSTTTAEAAGSTGGNSGKGGDLLYRWGNPAAHGAGTVLDQKLFNQHGTKFIEPGRPGAGNVLVFNNQVAGPPLHSEVWELERQADGTGAYPLAPGAIWGPAAPVWTYVAPNPGDFYSGFLSSAQRQPNGDTLVTSGTQAWLFEVTNAGAKVWEHFNTFPAVGGKMVFRSTRYEHYLWSDAAEVSAASGATVGFDLLAGSDFAGHVYLLLGSASGTSPGLPIDGELLPLVTPDPYFNLTLGQPNVAPFAQTLGVLDGQGRASASLTVPAGAVGALVGVTLDHAFVAIDPVGFAVSLASNSQSLTIVP